LAQAGESSESAQAFGEAHRRLLEDRSLQLEMKPFEAPEVPAWLRWLADFLEGASPFIKVLFWGAAAVLLLFILYRAARWAEAGGLDRFLKRDRERSKDEGPDTLRPEEAPARALLNEADALAAAGRFGDAARLVLHRSIEDIDARRPQTIRPALTGRDIAAVPELPPAPRSAFSRIVTLVERSLFAGRPLSEQDWRHCRSDYEEFAFGPGWRA
jgi:hypothetical protein